MGSLGNVTKKCGCLAGTNDKNGVFLSKCRKMMCFVGKYRVFGLQNHDIRGHQSKRRSFGGKLKHRESFGEVTAHP